MSHDPAQDSAAPAYGRFVWHDLMTSDLESATSFYTALLGWNVRAVPIGGGTYHMIFASASEDAPGIGGMEVLGGEEPPPPHWLGYVEVDQVDVTQRRAVEAGGQVLLPPSEIPGVGRFCIIQDPEGGCLAPFQSAGGRQPDPEPGSISNGQFVWNELLTHDTERCAAFYPEVFAWRHDTQEMPSPEGGTGTYHLWKRVRDGADVPHFDSGMMPMPPGAEAPTHWLHYVQVAEVDATVAKAEELGGVVHCPPTDIPSVGRFAVLADPQGASFAVFRPAESPASP